LKFKAVEYEWSGSGTSHFVNIKTIDARRMVSVLITHAENLSLRGRGKKLTRTARTPNIHKTT
ncbi:unnamed protein product, partial [marine sediment metagenome]